MLTNPMLRNLNQSNVMQGVAPVKNMLNIVRMSNNPQAMLNQMMSQNPKLRQVMDYVNQSGGDPKAAFYKMAQEKGIDPNAIINQLM